MEYYCTSLILANASPSLLLFSQKAVWRAASAVCRCDSAVLLDIVASFASDHSSSADSASPTT